MRKLFLFLFTTLALSAVHATVNAPTDRQGRALSTIDFVGAIPCRIDSSTATNAVLCGSAGRNIVYGVIVTSVAATNFLVFRDSATANTSSGISVSLLAETGSEDEGAATTLIHEFPVPIRFLNGISVNNTGTLVGEGSWTILYRPMSATE